MLTYNLTGYVLHFDRKKLLSLLESPLRSGFITRSCTRCIHTQRLSAITMKSICLLMVSLQNKQNFVKQELHLLFKYVISNFENFGQFSVSLINIRQSGDHCFETSASLILGIHSYTQRLSVINKHEIYLLANDEFSNKLILVKQEIIFYLNILLAILRFSISFGFSIS